MSCWRVLQLDHQCGDKQVPQLLVKPIFDIDSYTIFITDLTNIWTEELHLEGIVDRAFNEQSPIEVSKHDTAQLTILLENVQKALLGLNSATCRLSYSNKDGLTLHTSVILPKPLDSLTWKHHLQKQTSTTLKNELILPLLVSSHIQHERVSSLILAITNKDKAINRLLDQYESNNLDLAAAFPSIGSLKAGRKAVKREQAAKHIPALQPFCEHPWMELTEQLKDSDVTTLGLFQEALAHSTPRIPHKLKSEEGSESWWTAIPDELSPVEASTKSTINKPFTTASPLVGDVSSSGDETEDEFETHENFKKRNKPANDSRSGGVSRVRSPIEDVKGVDGSAEDDDDLDALPKSQRQGHSPGHNPRGSTSRIKFPIVIPEQGFSKSDAGIEVPDKTNAKTFRIGGKAKHLPRKPSSASEDQRNSRSPSIIVMPSGESVQPSCHVESQADPSLRKTRRLFKIGGKGKAANEETSRHATTVSPRANDSQITPLSTKEESCSPLLSEAMDEVPSMQEQKEETPEEKAERKRAELKRKNDEAAKKQAQQTKRKKRF